MPTGSNRSMTTAHVNRVATGVPPIDVHEAFVDYACSQLVQDPRRGELFRRLSWKGEIEHRYSYLQPCDEPSSEGLDVERFYVPGRFPPTSKRMQYFAKRAPALAKATIDRLELGKERHDISHVIVTCCTGFSAPGIDLQILDMCDLPTSVERTFIGFMGCSAAINGLKVARHIVRSDPSAKVLLVNLELSTLHFKETHDLEQILSFFLFADGCAASLISAEPIGIALDSFRAVLAPETTELITWNIGDDGFDMKLSGQVPGAIRNALCANSEAILRGVPLKEIDLWAVHPGGRTVLDAVQLALDLPLKALSDSRQVLRQFGNMSSATVMFVLNRLMDTMEPGQLGCGMAFGPGLVAETMHFHSVS
jgi:predicted naringenin-chalcone synthase